MARWCQPGSLAAGCQGCITSRSSGRGGQSHKTSVITGSSGRSLQEPTDEGTIPAASHTCVIPFIPPRRLLLAASRRHQQARAADEAKFAPLHIIIGRFPVSMNRAYYDGFLDADPVEPPGKAPPPPSAAGLAGPVIPAQARHGDYPPFESTRPTRPRDAVDLGHFRANGPRPRSLPPPYDAPRRRRRRSPSSSSSSSSECLPGRVRGVIKDNFTDSRSGVGVSVLGALVGGIVAHEVSHATVRSGDKMGAAGNSRRSEPARDSEKASKLATLAGAVVGGLGANAMEKRFEDSKRRDRLSRDDWVRKWGEDGGFWQSDSGSPFDHPPYRSRRRGTEEYEEVYEERKPRRKAGDAYRH